MLDIIFADKTTPNLNTILYNGFEVNTKANTNLGNRYLFGASLDGNISLSSNLSLRGDLSLITALKDQQYGPLPSISPVFGGLLMTYQKNNWFTSLRYQFSGSKDPEDYSNGGEDGLDCYKLIIENITRLMNKNSFLIFEIDFWQGDKIIDLSQENNLKFLSMKKDLSGQDRCLIFNY